MDLPNSPTNFYLKFSINPSRPSRKIFDLLLYSLLPVHMWFFIFQFNSHILRLWSMSNFSMSTHTSRHLPDLADVVHAWKKAFTRSFSWSVKLGPIYCPTVKVRHQALLSTWLLGVSSPTRQGNCIDFTDSAPTRSSKYLPALLIASWALWISISAVLLAYRKLCFSGYSAHQLRHLV